MQTESQASQGRKVQRVPRFRGNRGRQASAGQQVGRARQARWALKAQLVRLGPLAQQDFLALRGPQVCRALRVLQRREQQEPLDQPAKLVLLVQQALRVQRGWLGLLVRRV